MWNVFEFQIIKYIEDQLDKEHKYWDSALAR